MARTMAGTSSSRARDAEAAPGSGQRPGRVRSSGPARAGDEADEREDGR